MTLLKFHSVPGLLDNQLSAALDGRSLEEGLRAIPSAVDLVFGGQGQLQDLAEILNHCGACKPSIAVYRRAIRLKNRKHENDEYRAGGQPALGKSAIDQHAGQDDQNPAEHCQTLDVNDEAKQHLQDDDADDERQEDGIAVCPIRVR